MITQAQAKLAAETALKTSLIHGTDDLKTISKLIDSHSKVGRRELRLHYNTPFNINEILDAGYKIQIDSVRKILTISW